MHHQMCHKSVQFFISLQRGISEYIQLCRDAPAMSLSALQDHGFILKPQWVFATCHYNALTDSTGVCVCVSLWWSLMRSKRSTCHVAQQRENFGYAALISMWTPVKPVITMSCTQEAVCTDSSVWPDELMIGTWLHSRPRAIYDEMLNLASRCMLCLF